MNTTTLLIIIGVGVLVLLIGIIIIARVLSCKKAKKLEDNIKKLKSQKQDLDNDDRISLPQEEFLPKEEEFDEPIVEDFINTFETPKIEENFPNFTGQNDFQMFNNKPSKKQELDDFDMFMNEHSYSRKIFNKPLIEKIKKLPPDVRMLLLSNVFDRIDD